MYELIILVAFLFLSGLFSGLETAFVSVSFIKARALKNSNVKGGQALYLLKEKQRKVIIAVLIGNNLVNIGSSAYMTSVFLKWFGNIGVAYATGVMTFLILTFGEILPKTYFSKNSEKFSLKFTGFIKFLLIIFAPFIWFFESISNIFRIDEISAEETVSEGEIQAMIDVGAENHVIHKKQKQFLKSVFEFDDTKVKEIMTPRIEIFGVEENELIKDILKKVKIMGYSRILVYKGEIDKITGYLHIRDLLLPNHKELTAKNLKSDILFVSGEKIIQELFAEFQKTRNHIAIVVDEYGGTDGIVTMEDVLEELVGEIRDETDEDEFYIKKLDDSSWLVSGDAFISDLNEELNLKISESEFYPTISGYIQYKLNDLPHKDQEILDKRKKFLMKVVSLKEHTIERIKITKL